MTFDEFEVVANVAINNMRKLMASKGREYARTEDRFDNFNRLAADLDMSRDKVLLVYLTKHMDAIKNYVNTGESGSEPIQGRILDALNYLLLLYGMVEEGETAMRNMQRAAATQLVFPTAGSSCAEGLQAQSQSGFLVAKTDPSVFGNPPFGLKFTPYLGCTEDLSRGLPSAEDLDRVVAECKELVQEYIDKDIESTCSPALESYCGGEELVYRCNHYTQIGLNTFPCWLPLGHSSPHYNTILETFINGRTNHPLPNVWMKP